MNLLLIYDKFAYIHNITFSLLLLLKVPYKISFEKWFQFPTKFETTRLIISNFPSSKRILYSNPSLGNRRIV